MKDIDLILLFSGVIAGAAPILLATLGETLTEKAGFINLSLDGTILLSAMTAFVISFETGSTVAGLISACAVGALVAAVVAVLSIYLGQSQVAIGFVLTLMTKDLAYFLGNPYSRLHGPQILSMPIPLLSEIPVVGPIFFSHNFLVYISLALIVISWWYIYMTPLGLKLRAAGEHPLAAFSRGSDPNRLQLVYAILGGVLVGAAGAAFSLFVKPGWGRPQGAEGTGWIALALVIFGGWNPVRAAAGAYLFAFLQVIGIYLQGSFSSVPAQVFQIAPFPLMIFTLLAISFARSRSDLFIAEKHPFRKFLLDLFSGSAPSALGKPHRKE
ncbi:MAG: ABC transporter permease [Thermodesulfobacteriota bacterium]